MTELVASHRVKGQKKLTPKISSQYLEKIQGFAPNTILKPSVHARYDCIVLCLYGQTT